MHNLIIHRDNVPTSQAQRLTQLTHVWTNVENHGGFTTRWRNRHGARCGKLSNVSLVSRLGVQGPTARHCTNVKAALATIVGHRLLAPVQIIPVTNRLTRGCA
eukprot:1644020-Amphidinium_carterae.1